MWIHRHTKRGNKSVGLSPRAALELGRRQVAERGVQAFLVVNLFQKHAEAGVGVGQIAIFGALVE